VTHQVILKEVHLIGAKIVPANVQTLSQSMLGQPIKFKDIQQLAQKLEALYRADGYILVQVIIPPQEINIDSGIVQLQVINGAIKNIIFTGDAPKGAKDQLHVYAQKIENEDPISYHSIDRFLVLANQLPGIDVSATLVPDPKVTGSADLIVKIVQTPFSGFINFNNWNTSYIGPYQTSAGVSAYDLFGADALTLTGSTSINSASELQYGSINYAIIVGPYATEINPSISSTLTQPGGNLSNLELSGLSLKYNLSVNQPLYTSTQQSLTAQTSIYHTDSSNDAYSGAQTVYNDHITAFVAGLNYQGPFLQMYHDITFSITTGIPLGTPDGLANPSVTGAQTNFVHFNLLTSDIHYLTERLSVALATQFQYAPNTLVSSEQIGFGGQQFGQAFTPYIISGNSGAMGSLSLRYDLPLVWKLLNAELRLADWGFTQIQPEIFYDIGSVFYAAVPGTTNNQATAQSAGVGLNLQWRKNMNGTFVLAKPLSITNTPGTSLGWAGFFNLTFEM